MFACCVLLKKNICPAHTPSAGPKSRFSHSFTSRRPLKTRSRPNARSLAYRFPLPFSRKNERTLRRRLWEAHPENDIGLRVLTSFFCWGFAESAGVQRVCTLGRGNGPYLCWIGGMGA